MSEERNPTTENQGTNGAHTEETTGVQSVEQLTAEADVPTAPAGAEEGMDAEDEGQAEGTPIVEATSDAPVATAVEADEVLGEEAAPAVSLTAETKPTSAPVAASQAVQASGPAPTQTAGPKEYTSEYEVGGRTRRINIEVRFEEINYKNVALLGRFLDPRGRILSRRKTRVSAKVQRRVVNAIKLARHVALLPYTSDQTRIVRRRR